MIYRFIVISSEVDDFMREIKINNDATFLDFHYAIQKACGYKDDRNISFSICEDDWKKVEEITLEDVHKDSDEDSYTMKDTRLDDFIENEKQHLLYTFDPMAERMFYIELAEIITKKKVKAPTVSRSLGVAPPQCLDFDEILAQNPININETVSDDDEEEFYGDNIDDETDLEGLEITDGEPF